MKRAAALLLSVSLLGCFPHNAQHRAYAKYAEGGSLLAGIAMEAVINSGADCDQMAVAGINDSSCHTKATVLGDVGVALILGGLLGFVATVSTAEDNTEVTTRLEMNAQKPEDKPKLTLPPGVKGAPPADDGKGSAATGGGSPAPTPTGSAAPAR